MTALIALLATAAVTIFAVVVIRLDRQLRDEQVDADLLRIGDTAARRLSFDQGILSPDSPAIPNTVIALNPSFSIQEFEEKQELYGFPDPLDDEIDDYLRSAFEDSEFNSRVELLNLALEANGFEALIDELDYRELFDNEATTAGPVETDNEDGVAETIGPFVFTLDTAFDLLLDDPPEELAEEAYRRFVEEQAELADIELEFDTEYFTTTDNPLAEDGLFEISDTVTDNASRPLRDTITVAGQDWDIRATALRDGPEVRGAVIAVVDPTDFDAAHRDLRTRVVALALTIVAGSVVAAWFVAARTIHPTAEALAHQERFLADAAHELRTPIAAIRLTAESARPDTATTNLARVAELATQASELTDDLLTLARMDADRMVLRRERVRLDLLAESVIDALSDATGAVLVRGSTTVVDADPTLMARAISNLVRNALVHGEAIPTAPATITIEASGSSVSVTVRDHGPGIDPDVADTLFERFRSHTGSAGHGLGLALARWIAIAHGGELRAIAPDDGGAMFVLTITN